MFPWLRDLATISQYKLKSLSSESDVKEKPSTPIEDDYYLAPDKILGNQGITQLDPVEEVASMFLSVMTGYIVKTMNTDDFLCKVPIKKKEEPITKPKTESFDKVESLVSAEKVKCSRKARRAKKRSVIKLRRLSTRSSIDNIAVQQSSIRRLKSLLGKRQTLQKKSVSLPTERQSTLETIEEEEEGEAGREVEVKREGESKRESVEIIDSEEVAPQINITDSPPGSYGEKNFVFRKLINWAFNERDQIAKIWFKSGNRYFGRLSRGLMAGEGEYIWSNGMIYKGTFKDGRAHGKGTITWPDGSRYEGEMAFNKRHGHGVMYRETSEETRCYYGEWYRGKKHGKGVLIYGSNNWYDGDWKYGKRDGYGVRNYGTGTWYLGQFYNGMRSGRGTMVWSNNDIYIGNWQQGFVHGDGKLIWKAFRHTEFVAPLLNRFKGHFFEGRISGFGCFESAKGACIYTSWYFREKNGSGLVISSNGNRYFARNLFYNDRVVDVDLTDINMKDLQGDGEDDVELLNLLDAEELRRRVKSKLPNFHSPVHKMDFSMHIEKLFNKECNTTVEAKDSLHIPKFEKDQIRELESFWLERVIMKRISDLTSVYEFYARIGTNNKNITYKVALLRVMMWQLLRDCGIKQTMCSCVDLDIMVGVGTDPFDKVLMYEMIHYLLHLCWIRYLTKKPKYKNPNIPGVLASCFDVFIDKVVVKSKFRYKGDFLKYFRHVPLYPVYKLYRSIAVPLTIGDLCAKLIIPPEDWNFDEDIYTSEYIEYILQGKNGISADGSFIYIPQEEPFFDEKKDKEMLDTAPFAPLCVLGEIGPEAIQRAIAEVVPEATLSPGELDGDFKLSFLDFCDILVNLALSQVIELENFAKCLVEVSPKIGKIKVQGIKDSNRSSRNRSMRPSELSNKMRLSQLNPSIINELNIHSSMTPNILSNSPWFPRTKVNKTRDKVDLESSDN